MRNGNRIPTPWKHRWRRFRYSALPALSFLTCIAVTLWLWNRQGQMPNAVGEVYAVEHFVNAVADGTLLPLGELHTSNGPWWELGAPVEKDVTVVARLDGDILDAQMDVLNKELEGLQMAVAAKQQEIDLDRANRKFDRDREVAQLELQSDRLQLQAVQLTAQNRVDEVEKQGLQARLDLLKKATQGVVAQMRVEEARQELELVTKRIAESMKTLETVAAQQAALEQRKARLQPIPVAEVPKLLGPFRAEITTQQARIKELITQIAKLEIRAPITGRISAIHCMPGQHVREGDPIVTIAAVDTSYVLTYVRQAQRFRPAVGMPVNLRVRAPGSPPVESVVERVLPRMVEVPINHLRDPRIPEWGRPVLIGLPPEFKFTLPPGELIDLTFKF